MAAFSIRPGRRTLAAAALALALTRIAAADSPGPACALEEGGTGQVAGVPTGDTLLLDDGRLVRLAGILAPKAPLDAAGPAEAARDALARLAAGASVTLRHHGERSDRYGRILAYVFVGSDTEPLQAQLVAAGRARAEPVPDGACLGELLAAETKARQAGRGLWAEADYRIRQASEPSLGDQSGLYEVVEGRIVSIGRGRASVFLDFGRNWNADFTVTLTNSDAKLFDAAVGGLDSLVGRRVRVRGWLIRWRGPGLRLRDPAAIEVLD